MTKGSRCGVFKPQQAFAWMMGKYAITILMLVLLTGIAEAKPEHWKGQGCRMGADCVLILVDPARRLPKQGDRVDIYTDWSYRTLVKPNMCITYRDSTLYGNERDGEKLPAQSIVYVKECRK